MEELLIFFGLFGVQVMYGVYVVFLNRILIVGLDPLFLVIFLGLASAIFLLPFAIIFERKQWPTKFSIALMAQFVLLAFGGVTIYQSLMLLGIKKTSPAIASAMPNIAPGLIFLIAACMRYENFKVQCWYSRAKVLGTFVCLTGAVMMSLLQSPTTSSKLTNNATTILDKASDETLNNEWMLGCMYLLAAIVVLSCYTVMQATTMLSFPAPLSLASMTAFLGSLLTAVSQIITEGKINAGAQTFSLATIVAIVLVSGVVVGMCLAYQTWCIKKERSSLGCNL